MKAGKPTGVTAMKPLSAPDKGLTSSSVSYVDERYQRLKALAAFYSRKGYDKTTQEYKFYQKQDWEKLKEEFFVSGEIGGTYKYQNIEAFIRAKWKKEHRKFAILVVGPYPSKRVPWVGCWATDRMEEHWKQDKRIAKLSEYLSIEASASQISYSMASLYVDEIMKLKVWLDQLQKYSGGMLLQSPAKMTAKALDDAKREMRFVLSLESQLLNMLDRVRRSIQESVGGQQAVIAGLVRGAMGDALKSPMMVGGGTSADRVRNLVARMSEVAVARAELYDTKLPDLEPIDVKPEVKGPVQ